MNPYPFVGLNHFTVPVGIVRLHYFSAHLKGRAGKHKDHDQANAAGIPVVVGPYSKPMGHFFG
jgi:hypothetical protein